MARRGWQTPLEDPLPGIRTLRDAADHILQLPKAQQQTPHWQAAIEAVIMAAEGRGPLMHARIGMLRALNHGRPDPIIEAGPRRARKYTGLCDERPKGCLRPLVGLG